MSFKESCPISETKSISKLSKLIVESVEFAVTTRLSKAQIHFLAYIEEDTIYIDSGGYFKCIQKRQFKRDNFAATCSQLVDPETRVEIENCLLDFQEVKSLLRKSQLPLSQNTSYSTGRVLRAVLSESMRRAKGPRLIDSIVASTLKDFLHQANQFNPSIEAQIFIENLRIVHRKDIRFKGRTLIRPLTYRQVMKCFNSNNEFKRHYIEESRKAGLPNVTAIISSVGTLEEGKSSNMRILLGEPESELSNRLHTAFLTLFLGSKGNIGRSPLILVERLIPFEVRYTSFGQNYFRRYFERATLLTNPRSLKKFFVNWVDNKKRKKSYVIAARRLFDANNRYHWQDVVLDSTIAIEAIAYSYLLHHFTRLEKQHYASFVAFNLAGKHKAQSQMYHFLLRWWDIRNDIAHGFDPTLGQSRATEFPEFVQIARTLLFEEVIRRNLSHTPNADEIKSLSKKGL